MSVFPTILVKEKGWNWEPVVIKKIVEVLDFLDVRSQTNC
jgi:hypothetical protein